MVTPERAVDQPLLIDFQPLINRLQKNYRHLRKWAQREKVENYRLYDHDIPEFPLIVELYEVYSHPEQAAQRQPASREILVYLDLHFFQKHQTNSTESLAQEQLSASVVQAFGDLPISQLHLKLRGLRAGGTRALGAQSERVNLLQRRWIRENNLVFEVNPASHHDVGFFLDHRKTRQLVAQRSAGRRILNLFAYTGSFSVYAAFAQAQSVTTVDMSSTYLEWAWRNLECNGLAQRQGDFLVREDVLKWLELAHEHEQQYDLIVCDPPTFSNSKKMDQVFNVQLSHPQLLKSCLDVLAPGGEIFFSCNHRHFKMQCPGFIEISAQTQSLDFPRAGHRCWKYRAQDSVGSGPQL